MVIRPSYLINQIPLPPPPPALYVNRNSVQYVNLCNYMKHRTLINIADPSGRHHQGKITGIRLEDGSGHNWILTIARNDNAYVEIFVRAN